MTLSEPGEEGMGRDMLKRQTVLYGARICSDDFRNAPLSLVRRHI